MKNYQLGLYEKALPNTLSLAEKQAVAAEAGYDYLEMSIDASEEKIARVYEIRTTRLETAKALGLDLEGLPVGSFCVSALTKFAIGSLDEATRERGLEIGLKSIELAAVLGVRTVMIPGYDVYYEPSSPETEALFITNCRKLAAHAAFCGVQVGFETMENEFMNTMTKAAHYVQLVDSPYLMIYPDLGNMTNASVLHESDLLTDMEAGRGKVLAMHLKETKPGIFREVPYGTGHVDFEAGVKKAWSLGVRRYVTEYWYTGTGNYRQEASDTAARFRRLLDKQEDQENDRK